MDIRPRLGGRVLVVSELLGTDEAVSCARLHLGRISGEREIYHSRHIQSKLSHKLMTFLLSGSRWVSENRLTRDTKVTTTGGLCNVEDLVARVEPAPCFLLKPSTEHLRLARCRWHHELLRLAARRRGVPSCAQVSHTHLHGIRRQPIRLSFGAVTQ